MHSPVLQSSALESRRADGGWWRLPVIRYAVLSLAILIPCFWQIHLQANDLSSHLYSAWLASEADAGHLLGVFTVHQFTNVLFDFMLDASAALLPWKYADRPAVAACVLVFFWGAFAFISRHNSEPAWRAAPLLAVLSYGVVLRMGFINFYLSLGLCLWALAFLHRRRWWAAGLLMVLACTAHLMPVGWVLCVAAYLYLPEIGRHPRLVRFSASLAGLAVVMVGVRRIWPTAWSATDHLVGLNAFIGFVGLDQAWLYRAKYFIVAVGLAVLCAFVALRKLDLQGWRGLIHDARIQLLFLHALAYASAPSVIQFPMYEHALAFVPIRISLFTAIILILVYASTRVSRVEAGLACGVAALFFSFVWVDEAAINGLQRKVDSLVTTVPAGSRVIAMLYEENSRAQVLSHLVDRSCMGYCFSYAHYEPSTTQFRLRAVRRNAFVLSDIDRLQQFDQGTFTVQPWEAPIYQIDLCADALCVRKRRAGDRLGRTTVEVLPRFW